MATAVARWVASFARSSPSAGVAAGPDLGDQFLGPLLGQTSVLGQGSSGGFGKQLMDPCSLIQRCLGSLALVTRPLPGLYVRGDVMRVVVLGHPARVVFLTHRGHSAFGARSHFASSHSRSDSS